MYKIIFILTLILNSNFSIGQNVTCGTILDINQLQSSNPTRFQQFQDLENFTANYIASHGNNRLINLNGIITIPVIVHVIHCGESIGTGRNISNERIQSQIDVLNEDFRKLNADWQYTPDPFKIHAADLGIEFKLACMDQNGNFTNGIVRKESEKTSFTFSTLYGEVNENAIGIKKSSLGGDDPWPTDKFLNIWVCKITNNSPWGYGTFPADFAAKPQYDGVVVDYNNFGRYTSVANQAYEKGRSLTHEIGHWLNLRHIWGDAVCGDDFCNDTPTQEKENFYSPVFPNVSSCSPNSNGDMFMNFMDYTADISKHLFTNDQKLRTRAIFAPGGPRAIMADNYLKPIAKTTPIFCNGKIKLFNPLCLSNVTWSVVSGPATITSFNDNEAFVSSPTTGNITIRASAGNYVSEQTYQVSQESPSITGINYNNGLTNGNPVMWFNPSNPIGSVNDVCIGFGFPNRFVDAVPYGSSENEVVWSVVNNTPQSGFSILQQNNNRAYFNFNFADSPTGYLQASVSGCGTYTNVVAFKQINCNPGGNPCDAALGQKFYTVSPNPASDQITIGVSNRPAPVDCNGLRALTTNKGNCFSAVNIYNNMGTLVKSFRTVSSKSASLQISNLITGNYIVEIIEGDYIEKQQLIVQ